MTIEKSNDLIGNGTRDISACSIVLQSTTLPSAPIIRKWAKRAMKAHVVVEVTLHAVLTLVLNRSGWSARGSGIILRKNPVPTGKKPRLFYIPSLNIWPILGVILAFALSQEKTQSGQPVSPLTSI
jgi:hypothetical protein